MIVSFFYKCLRFNNMNNKYKTWGTRIFLLGISMLVIVACSNDSTTTPQDNPNTSSTELLSLKTSSAPTIDGKMDDIWRQAQRLITSVQVPDPKDSDGKSVFAGYVGDKYDVTMRSMYDNEYIYFLVEYTDLRLDLDRETWYFDTATKMWMQESRWPTFDANGNVTRKAFYEDKFTFLWNGCFFNLMIAYCKIFFVDFLPIEFDYFLMKIFWLCCKEHLIRVSSVREAFY